MAGGNSSVNEVVAQIAFRLLLTDADYHKLKDEDNSKDKINILKIKYKDTVIETIESAYASLKDSLPPGVPVPIGANQMIATRLLKEVERKGISGLEEIKSNDAVVKEIFNIPSKPRVDNIKEEAIATAAIVNEVLNIEERLAIVEQISTIKEERILNVFKTAHKKDATESEKQAAVAIGYSDKIDDLLSYGLGFYELDNYEQGFIVATINSLMENGNEEIAKKYMQAWGIKSQVLEDKKYKGYVFELDTIDAQDDIELREINKVANAIYNFNTNKDKLSPELRREKKEELFTKIEGSKYGLSAVIKALANPDFSKENNFDDKDVLELVDFAIKKFEKNENSVEIDEFDGGNIVKLIVDLNDKNPEKAQKLFKVTQSKLKENGFNFDYSQLAKLDKSLIGEIVLATQADNFNKEIKNDTNEYGKKMSELISNPDREKMDRMLGNRVVRGPKITKAKVYNNKFDYDAYEKNMGKVPQRKKMLSFYEKTDRLVHSMEDMNERKGAQSVMKFAINHIVSEENKGRNQVLIHGILKFLEQEREC